MKQNNAAYRKILSGLPVRHYSRHLAAKCILAGFGKGQHLLLSFFRGICLFLLPIFLVLIPVNAAEAMEGIPIAAVGQLTERIETAAFAAVSRIALEKEIVANGETRRYTIDLVRAPKPLRLPKGIVRFDTAIPNGVRYAMTTPVYITVFLDNKPFRKFICYYKVHVFDNVVVAARSLLPHRQLEAKDVRIEEREITNSATRYLTDSHYAVGRELNRLAREGMLLTEQMLKNPVIMEIGSQVMIVSRKKGIEVRTEGETLQRGRIGSIIRVKNITSKKVIMVRVIDATTVEVLRK